jgi:hypothetical protein
MRRIVLVSLFALLVTAASAQGRGGGARGVAHGGIAFRPAFTGGHGYGSLPSGRGYGHLSGGYGYLGGGYGYGYSDGDTAPYDAGGYAFSPQQVYLDPSPAPPPVIQVAPKPAHPVLTNYTWPAVSAPSAAAAPEAEAQTFGIVLKDGSTLAATTIVAADDVLHYVDPDERHMRVSMSAVDRAATLKLNRERKLDLYLPASPQ